MPTWYQNLRTKTCSLRLRAFTPGLTPGVPSPISDGAIDVFAARKEPFLLIITLIAVLVDGERPILHLPRVLQTTDGRETSIILPIQIEKLPPVPKNIQAM